MLITEYRPEERDCKTQIAANQKAKALAGQYSLSNRKADATVI